MGLGSLHSDFQNAVFERALDAIRIGALWKVNLSFETPVGALGPVVFDFLFFAFVIAFAGNTQLVIADFQIKSCLLDAGKIGPHHVFTFLLQDVDVRPVGRPNSGDGDMNSGHGEFIPSSAEFTFTCD